MTKKSIYFGTLLLTALAFGSCASDDTATDKTAGKETPKTGTVFSSEDEPSTRTSATYTGSGLDFYWTANDKIWVKDDNNTYHQSSEDDIANRIAAVPGSTTTAKAKFWVNGTYTGPTHKVRYTGNSGASDKVTIKASQTQSTPNDAAHIADDGDFGVADATGSGKYTFTLNHKAAYVTFMPHTTDTYITGAKIKKITMWSGDENEHLAGTFNMDDNGTLSGGTSTTNRITLNVNDFTIPTVTSYTANAATMVVAPGTYHNVAIEYTLEVPTASGTPITGTLTKLYSSVTFDAGKNTPVKTDLKVKVYPANSYYEWDAAVGQNFWKGYEYGSVNPQQPTINDQDNPTYAPQNWRAESASNPRGYRDDTSAPTPFPEATRSAANCLNVNEALWYCFKGDPHSDIELWALMGHVYAGGMWFKKQTVIATKNSKTIIQLKDKAPDNIDYRLTGWLCCGSQRKINNNVIAGKPSNLNEYFYLPYLGGYYDNGRLRNLGVLGLFNTSTPHPTDPSSAASFFFYFGQVCVDFGNRTGGFQLFNSSNENEYRPF